MPRYRIYNLPADNIIYEFSHEQEYGDYHINLNQYFTMKNLFLHTDYAALLSLGSSVKRRKKSIK